MNAVMYRCYDGGGRLIYVGSTSSYRRRLGEHMRQSWWYSMVDRLTSESFRTLEAARAAEEIAIQEEQPAFNTWCTGRDWLARRDHWTAADHALHTHWAEERGQVPTALRPPIRGGSFAARAAARAVA